MKVLKRDVLKDGTEIQIEDWSQDYDFITYGSSLVAYAKSKNSLNGDFSPKVNQVYRFEFNFTNYIDTEIAYQELLNGSKNIIDFKDFIREKHFESCL